MATRHIGKSWVILDVHLYTLKTAVAVVARELEDAYLNGFETVVVIHGARDVRTQAQAEAGRRGTIKWKLRELFQQGAYSKWVKRAQDLPDNDELRLMNNRAAMLLMAEKLLLTITESGPNDIKMEFTLKRPEKPRPEPTWSVLPQDEF